ncbi:S8 family serine peptidase [Desertibacillus haloalkaliphilus]|nr:S8 family serine peptidase [Desertibacillus haloalkaliphilus]
MFVITPVAEANQFPERPPIPVHISAEETIVIVELSDDLQNVIEVVKDKIPSGKVRKKFDTLFSGFSYQLPENKIPLLEEISGVERVSRVVTYEATLDESVPFIGGEQVRGQLDENGSRLTGEGITVAVIDTGIDYTHPDLKDSYKGGFDVVDWDEDPMETKAKQGPPTLHGTHVSGIIAADGKVKGVAPKADLLVYRTLGPGGQGTTEQVIEAIEKAVEDGADIINLSLGNNVNGPDWPTSLALDKAVEHGVVAVTSNGNSGPNMWTVGSPGTSKHAISVGASSPPLKKPYLTVFGEDREIDIQPLRGSKPWMIKRGHPIVYGGLARANDLEDVDGKIVLAKRGVIPFTEKAMNARDAGAKALLIYNNTEGAFLGGLGEDAEITVAALTQEDGEWLKDIIDHEGEPELRTIYREEEDLLASFSSRGPVTHSWDVKPEVVAPGVSIDSTIPKGYLGLNGTSMAAPHVAGAAALIKQAHPDWSPEQIKAALMNTAKQIVNKEGETYLPHEQGAGRIQIDKAVEADTLVYPGAVTFGKWSLNDRRETKEITITVDNQSEKTNTYYVDPPLDAPDGIQWKAPFSFTLAPKERKEVTVTMDIMPSVLKEGIHHGNITIKGGKEDIEVPYLFFIEEPNYPRVMAFNFEHGDEPDSYRYEMYLPGGAEEVGIALYDPDTFQFITYLDVKKDITRGLLEVELEDIGLEDGVYKALVFASQDEQEDTIEHTLYIGEHP